ncbi:hypothetical protein [Piscibacillus salipiscarius]|uniref:Uncharacterized protein n=1 Tax=Piscibacillus salipiscarius TaxID=299480 RepID=A0ABW5Q7M4_9BACI|nr:hypothetical protein [Piscibacillus salipiscarius]
MGGFSFIGLIITLIPIVLTILVIIWILQIRDYNHKQVEQNKRIIELLDKKNDYT